MGEVLGKITEACLTAGATPVFAHHTVKHAGKKPGRNGTLYQTYEPAELGDLAFAGFAEFARQWLLIARREDYEPGTGLHRLWLTTGGSAGFNGCDALDVDEGVMQEDFSGKKWEVRVQTQAEAARSQVTAKLDAAARRDLEDREKVLNALTEHGGREGITVNKLVPHIGMRRSAVERHLAALSDSGGAEICGEFRGGNVWKASCWNRS
jgi:DNA-binding transcriptional ArsR family regulator